MSTTITRLPATERQMAFLSKLAAERAPIGDRQMTGEDQTADEQTAQVVIARSIIEDPARWDRKQVSKVIDMLLAIRPPAPATKVTPSVDLDLRAVPSGRYAVPGGDSRLKVQIDVCDSGKWAGWVFVKDAAEYGHGKRYGSQRPGQGYSGAISDALAAIAADPREASAAYGRLVGCCGVCGRHLEDAESVARGIGPVCARKF